MLRSPLSLTVLVVVGCVAMLAGFASATCGAMTCPSNWQVVPFDPSDTKLTCDYSCLSPVKLNCVSKLLPSSTWQKLYQPYLCGGTSAVKCPAISCAYTSTYAVSGPQGCAFAKSVIEATSMTVSNYSYAESVGLSLKTYCSSPDSYPLVAFAQSAATSFAKVVAQTLAQWNVFVCNCGCGTLSANYAVVSADLQSVAISVAQAYTAALASVESCLGDLLAGSLAQSEGLASSTMLAIDTVYKQYVFAPASPQCTGPIVGKSIEKAVAEATVCVFAQVFAAAANNFAMSNGTNAVAISCGESISFTQLGTTCPPYSIGCTCTPASVGLKNLGFELGIPGANPAWTASDGVAAVGPQGTISPSEGSLMASISAGCPTSSLTTTVKVPKCVSSYGDSQILFDFIYDCKDYSPFNDYGSVTVTASNSLTSTTVSKTISCADVGDFGFSNGGQWTTMFLPAPPGTYTLKVEGTSTNALDCAVASTMYLDNIRFA